jgi:hypothetical protein
MPDHAFSCEERTLEAEATPKRTDAGKSSAEGIVTRDAMQNSCLMTFSESDRTRKREVERAPPLETRSAVVLSPVHLRRNNRLSVEIVSL